MAESEKQVEAALVELVENLGGLCEKFTSPNRRNVPDRLVTWPNGDIHFVELKAPGKRPNAGQERDHRRRLGRRAVIVVIDHLAGVEAYVSKFVRVGIGGSQLHTFYRGGQP